MIYNRLFCVNQSRVPFLQRARWRAGACWSLLPSPSFLSSQHPRHLPEALPTWEVLQGGDPDHGPGQLPAGPEGESRVVGAMGVGSLGSAEGLKELVSVSSLRKWVEWCCLQAHGLCSPELSANPLPPVF